MPERHFFCVFPQLIIHKYKANLAVVEWSAQWFKANSVWSMLGVSSSSSQCPKTTHCRMVNLMYFAVLNRQLFQNGIFKNIKLFFSLQCRFSSIYSNYAQKKTTLTAYFFTHQCKKKKKKSSLVAVVCSTKCIIM